MLSELTLLKHTDTLDTANPMRPRNLSPDIEAPPNPALIHSRIARRTLPLFLLLYVMSYLDRTSVAFARVPMSEDLGFSEATYGLASGLFFVGYLLMGLPGALIVERWGARRWIGLTAVCWGLVTIATAFVGTPTQFYVARLVLGLAAAGFFPGVIIFLSKWFPQRNRSKALAGFMIAAPLALTIAGPLSALILASHLPGLSNWRWVFIVEGFPAILLGVTTFIFLRDSPANAEWLSKAEREVVEQELRIENTDAPSSRLVRQDTRWWRFLRNRNVLLLCSAHAFATIAGYGFIFWLPVTVKNTIHVSAATANAVSAAPYALAAAAMWLMGRSSDRTGERRLHACIPMLSAAVFFAMTLIPQQPPILTLTWLFAAGACVFAWIPAFWVIPTAIAVGPNRAASIGLINSVGNIGGFLGPMLIGQVLSKTQSSRALVLVVSLSYCCSATITACCYRLRSDPRQSP